MNAWPMLVARDVRKSFGSLEVLKGIRMEVHRGEVVCIIGPSGSGKSTFLRCINHLEKIDGGRLYVDGELVGYRRDGNRLIEMRDSDAATKRAEIGMVFQQFNLFPHKTALGNVIEAPIVVGREKRGDAVTHANSLLQRVGLADKVQAYPEQLSGGQQQRVAIARALAMRPKLLLFAEATSALDPELVGEVLEAVRELKAEGMTMLIVTHEMSFAREVADFVGFLHDGMIAELGPPEEVLRSPQRPETQRFLRRLLEAGRL
jgi:polar amino acid transport system ATP-binding protein